MEDFLDIHIEQLLLTITTLKALYHPLRKQMIEFIAEKKTTTVTEIYKALNIEQAIASQHLAWLRKVKIVNAARQGHHVFYSLNYTRLKQVEQVLKYFEEEKKSPVN